jgi:hypothetical protein
MKYFLVLIILIFNMQSLAIPVIYAITVSTEAEELKRILKQLSSNLDEEDKILLQVDQGNETKEVIKVINELSKNINKSQFKVIYFALNEDFASFKNNLLANAGDQGFMFQIDADEYLSSSLMQNLKYYLAENLDVDLIYIPRANYYINMEGNAEFQEWVRKDLDELGRFRYPDPQGRLIRLANKKIKYKNKLHEQIIGVEKNAQMPNYNKSQNWDLIHIKTMKKQNKSEILYQKISPTDKIIEAPIQEEKLSNRKKIKFFFKDLIQKYLIW